MYNKILELEKNTSDALFKLKLQNILNSINVSDSSSKIIKVVKETIADLKQTYKICLSTNNISRSLIIEANINQLQNVIPKELSNDEIKTEILTYLNENNISEIKDIGKVFLYLYENYDGLYNKEFVFSFVDNFIKDIKES